jgi:hypothetical protein
MPGWLACSQWDYLWHTIFVLHTDNPVTLKAIFSHEKNLLCVSKRDQANMQPVVVREDPDSRRHSKLLSSNRIHADTLQRHCVITPQATDIILHAALTDKVERFLEKSVCKTLVNLL